MRVTLILNKKKKTFNIPPNRTLIDLLRTQGLWSVKRGCETGDCGSCTVIVEGLAVNSCIMLAAQADGKSIETFESIATAQEFRPLQDVFMDFDLMECGYCIPGIIMSIKAMLDKNPEPTKEEVFDAIAGNLCRCSANMKPMESIMEAIKKIRGKY